MKFKTSTLLLTFIWCWFMGITAISIGFGAVFPSMNLVAKPFVCPSGKMELETQTYNPYPGNTTTTLTWYCTDSATSTRTELGIFPMSLYSGTLYGWLLFGVVVIIMAVNARKQPNQRDRVNPVFTSHQGPFETPYITESAMSRMKELKQLRAANMISEAEYEQKRAEILKDL